MKSSARRILAALLALCFAQSAIAQSFPKPPDVPTYVPVTPSYASGTTLNIVGDGSTTGGVPPAAAIELTEVSPVTEPGWTVSGSAGTLTTASGGTSPEAKFRTRTSGDVKILFDDPIRNYGLPGSSHCHEFFGNQSTNAYSTYSSLRTHARKRSWAQGGPLNGTAYWFPCVIKDNPFGDGKDYVVRPNTSVIIYYTNPPTQSIKITRLLLGLRYVGGYDMDAGATYLQGLITTANAQPGTSGRYRACQSASPAHIWSANGNCGSYFSWRCISAVDGDEIWAEGFKNADNSDPFGGECTAGQDLWVQFEGPGCWDGRNLWSPGGYKHVMPRIWDTVKNNWTCPNTWYQLPLLALQIHFPHQGFSDYGTWVLASDAAAGTLPGRSFHTDWFNGWDRTALTQWLLNCIGIGNEGGTPRTCDGGSMHLIQLIANETAPTGRGPQTGTFKPGSTTSAAGMTEIPAQSNGPAEVTVGD